MIIKDTLEGQQFTIHTAANGEEGLRRFFDLRPDVLVVDVMMPRMDGFEIGDYRFNSRSLHVFITKLRHKLSQDERIRIVNVRGIGYKLIVN